MNSTLTPADHLVLRSLLTDIASTVEIASSEDGNKTSVNGVDMSIVVPKRESSTRSETTDVTTIEVLKALNDPNSDDFEPTVFVSWDVRDLGPWSRVFLTPYINWARKAA